MSLPVVDGEPAGSAEVHGPAEPRGSTDVLAGKARNPWVTATLFVVPYLVLMLCWAMSNPPGAAPDETDHLVKAIGMATFDIGTTYTGPSGRSLGSRRNTSISRVIPVPANLVPQGFGCELTRPTVSAGCLPGQVKITSTATRYVTDPLGSYPPFLYPLMGWVARLATTWTQAAYYTRVFCALVCALLLLLGVAHLVRALGRRALLGAFVTLTPTVIFCGSAVTTSGIEICSAFAVGAIVVVALRRPASLAEPGTQFLLAGVGATLILSRQLGVVTFGLLMLLLVARLGPRFFWELVKSRRPAFFISVGVLLTSAVAIAVWERGYDHPSHVGSALSADAFGAYSKASYSVLQSGVALFGWLDTYIPAWFVAAWITLCVLLVGAAILIGSRADRWTLIAWSVILIAIGYFTYATVFFPLGAALQGRHLLAFFTLIPLLAGVTVGERLEKSDPAVGIRLSRIVAVLMPVLQFVSLYMNSRRYAVGSAGRVWFLPVAQWNPPLGWAPWLVLALLACAALAGNIWTTAGRPQGAEPLPPVETQVRVTASVER